MISSISSTLSALTAYGKKMQVVSDNVANSQSDGFKKSQAVFMEGENSSINVDIQKVETAGPVIAEVQDGEIVEKELSNVDFVEEIPQAIVAQSGYEANLKTVQVQDEMMQGLIDIVG
jgi:flagellar basal body rod protein FlgG